MRIIIIKILKAFIIVAIFAWYGLFLSHKIDLSTADLGRHITNGSVIINGSWPDKWAVLHTNFYSYTLPNQPFVNHHWLSGVVFYFINQFFGFFGLSILYLVLGLATLWLFFDVARRASNFWIASAITITVTPLIASRAEVRPEMFTYFFTGVFFWVLWRSRKDAPAWPVGREINTEGRGSYKLIWLLPILMLLWVNLHIGFVFGFLVLGAFGLELLIKDIGLKIKDKASQFPSKDFFRLFYLSIFCTLAGLVNPNFIRGFLYPLSIFKNYGYLIVENQSIKFLENLNFTSNQHFLLFKIIAIVVVISFIAAAIKNWRRGDIAMFVLVSVASVMAYLGIRNFPSFAFFAIPALASNIYLLWPKTIHVAYKYALALIIVGLVVVSLFQQYQTFVQIKPALGFGLLPGVSGSADFFQANNIRGPIFNNYDNGGYLIYSLNKTDKQGLEQRINTDTKVFVDNRPEAYTPDFFKKVYEAAQLDAKQWEQLDSVYHFNVIFFAYHDYTPWAQAFLISKINDPAWAPVYVDSYNLIFLKRNQQNQNLIKKYELPKSMFGVTPVN